MSYYRAASPFAYTLTNEDIIYSSVELQNGVSTIVYSDIEMTLEYGNAVVSNDIVSIQNTIEYTETHTLYSTAFINNTRYYINDTQIKISDAVYTNFDSSNNEFIGNIGIISALSASNVTVTQYTELYSGGYTQGGTTDLWI